ncbi:hypothetical protein VAA_04043 [Vibrio anguillarum 775]|nr:hypothetical protein VAA_04043 [Vibrio anguillarum 775]
MYIEQDINNLVNPSANCGTLDINADSVHHGLWKST